MVFDLTPHEEGSPERQFGQFLNHLARRDYAGANHYTTRDFNRWARRIHQSVVDNRTVGGWYHPIGFLRQAFREVRFLRATWLESFRVRDVDEVADMDVVVLRVALEVRRALRTAPNAPLRWRGKEHTIAFVMLECEDGSYGVDPTTLRTGMHTIEEYSRWLEEDDHG